MLYKLPIILAMIFSVTHPELGIELGLAAFLCVIATMFYFLMFNALSGQKEVSLDIEHDLNDLWINRTITISASAFVYMYGYTDVFFYVLPFLVVGTLCDLLATGFKLGWLSFEELDRDAQELEDEE